MLNTASKILSKLKTKLHQDDFAFVLTQTANYPNDIRLKLLAKYDKTLDEKGSREANLALGRPTRQYPPTADLDDDQLLDIAKDKVSGARLFTQGQFDAGTYLRSIDVPLQLRRLRKKHRREREVEMLNFGMVHKGKNKYASSRALRDMAQQDYRCENIMKKRFLVCDDKKISMDKVAKEAAEKHTYEVRGRLMAMADIMKINKWQAAFGVVTLRPTAHPSSPKWDETMPDEAHAWVNLQWSRIRAQLAAEGIKIGRDIMILRTAEAHQDACPHYNFVVISSGEILARFKTLLFEKYLHNPEAEPCEASLKNRITWNTEKGDDACRRIVSYASKYALKTYLPADKHKSKTHRDEYERSRAWRQTWSIRAFTLAGFAPSGLWKECRSKHYAKSNVPLVIHAKNTDFVAFHFEYQKLIAEGKIKPIHAQAMNKYGEEIKEIVGHMWNDKLIAERESYAEIIKENPNLQLYKLNQGGDAAGLTSPDAEFEAMLQALASQKEAEPIPIPF